MSQKSSAPPTCVLAEKLVRDIRRAIWGAMNTPGEDAAISRDSLPLASRGFRMVERV
jgi:hypothetical protein